MTLSEDRTDEQQAEYLQAFHAMRRQSKDAQRLVTELSGRYPDDQLFAFHADRLAAGEDGVVIRLEDE